MIINSVDDQGRTDNFKGGPAGRCGSVLTTISALGALFPAGPSAITRNVYFVAGFRSSIKAAYCRGVSVISSCCQFSVRAQNIACKYFGVDCKTGDA